MCSGNSSIAAPSGGVFFSFLRFFFWMDREKSVGGIQILIIITLQKTTRSEQNIHVHCTATLAHDV